MFNDRYSFIFFLVYVFFIFFFFLFIHLPQTIAFSVTIGNIKLSIPQS